MELKKISLQDKVDLSLKIKAGFDEKIHWQEAVKSDIIKAFLAWEHVLLESMQWLWKTVLAKSLSESTWLKFTRIQWTPDLMPQDILGYTTVEWKKVEWPIVTNILLIDEINRINPKTLSSLLSAMSEKLIVDMETWLVQHLPDTFFVIATQNPFDTIGTFDLPEATKDRFAIKIYLKKENWALIPAYKLNNDEIPCDISKNIFDKINSIFDNLDPNITEYDYIKKAISYWPSIRAGLQFIKIVKTTAFLSGRSYVTIDDLKDNIIQVFWDKIWVLEEFTYKWESINETLLRYKNEF